MSVSRWPRLRMLAVCAQVVMLLGACERPGKKSPEAAPPNAAAAPVPEPEDVTAVEVVVTAASAPEPRYTFTVSDRKVIASLAAVLEQVDWTQEGDPLEEIRIAPPEIELTFLGHADRKHWYAFYWTGNGLVGDGRMIEAELASLRQLVIDELVRRHCGGRDKAALPDGESKNEIEPPQEALAGAPDEDDVAAMDFVVSPSSAAKPRCSVAVKDDYWIDNAVALLRRIDWSQEGAPLERMQILRPDIDLTLRTNEGAAHRYQFYWQEEGFIDLGSGRFLKADVSVLRRLAVEVLIAACADPAKEPRQLQSEATYKPEDTPYSVALAPDARMIAVAYPRSREVLLWDAQRRKVRARSAEIGRVRGLSFFPDGKRLVCLVDAEPPPQTISNELEVHVLELPELRRARKLGAASGGGWMLPLAFSPDGRFLATVTPKSISPDGRIRW